jgi:hypothetical protein
MLRNNHYDVAFEAFLRTQRTPYVVVDEARRALLNDASLKSMDFIVYSSRAQNLLVDVKGRRFPSGGPANRHEWENWATHDDIKSLLHWQQVFGNGFRALLVFAYDIADPRALARLRPALTFRKRAYAFYGVWVDDYSLQMRVRSQSWETVSLPSRAYRELRAPIEQFL